MKVLLPIIYHDLTHCIARAFEEEGHEVRVVDWRKYQKEQHRHKIEPFCIEQARDFLPDLSFCQFQAPGYITKALPEFLSSIGCFSVNWSGDVRSPLPDWYKELAPYFGVTSFTNVPDVEEIRSMGHRSEFLQIGYDERLYYPRNEKRSGVVFIGNNYGGYKYAESGTRREMVATLTKAFGPEFMAYGMSWENAGNSNGGYVREPEDADVLNRALIAVGMDHFFRAGFASDRLTRATACGCAVVQWHYDGIDKEHPYVIAVRSLDEMVERVKYLLYNPDEASRLGALNAHNTANNHRWNERVKIIETWMR